MATAEPLEPRDAAGLSSLEFLLPHRSTGDTLDTIVSRLKIVVFIRVVAVTFFAVAALMFELDGTHRILAGTSERFLYVMTSSMYLLSLGYTIALRAFDRVSLQRVNAYVQVVFDILFVAFLVSITRLTDSVFVFLFSVVIVNASILLPWPGAMVATALATSMLLAISAVQLHLGEVQAFLEGLGAPAGFFVSRSELALLSSRTGILYNLGLNIIAFISIGLLATYLAGQLRRAQVILQEKRDSLRALQVLYQHVVQSLPVALVTTAQDGLITFANPEAQRLMGEHIEENPYLGLPLDEFFPALRTIIANEDKLAKAHSETTVGVVGRRRLHLRWTIAPLAGPKESPIGRVFIFQDITRMARMEAERKRMDRLATIGQLAAGIAHEIRNPLASISGSIQLLRDTVELSADERRLMDIVVRETDSLNTRITEFLAFARPRRSVRRPTDLRGVLLETADVFRNDPRAAERDIVVSEEWPSVTSAALDEGGLRQLLWNLLANAGEATEPGDTVTLRLENLVHDVVPHIVLVVEDTGCGMAPSDLKRVTEPFFTTKEGGTGLGLATVQRTVEDHGGFLRIVSKRGRGSRFSVALPIKAKEDAMESEESQD